MYRRLFPRRPSPRRTGPSTPWSGYWREESGAWNDQFEVGKILVFAVTSERRLIRPIREVIQANGVSEASYYVVDRRLGPRAVGQAVMHRAGAAEQRDQIAGAQDA